MHLTVRGFGRKPIFLDQYDHEEFLTTFRYLNRRLSPEDRLTELSEAGMINHRHSFVRNGQSPTAITQVMHSLQIRYAHHFNWRYGKRGKVFEKPFRGKVVRGADHVMNTFAYIHLNPDASLRIENSSHGVYIGVREDPLIDTSLAWQVFGNRDGYLDFFNDTARVRAARAQARARLLD